LIFKAGGDMIAKEELSPAKGVKMLPSEPHDKNDVNPRTDMRGTFNEIRETIDKAQTKEDLTELYKRSVYMILMTHSSPLDDKLDQDLKRKREVAEKEFVRTVHMINQRAKEINVEADYSEHWENLATNGYETEDENLLEAQRSVGIVKE
jgi:hypothetical protein